jgi:hypothetical protein
VAVLGVGFQSRSSAAPRAPLRSKCDIRYNAIFDANFFKTVAALAAEEVQRRFKTSFAETPCRSSLRAEVMLAH